MARKLDPADALARQLIDALKSFDQTHGTEVPAVILTDLAAGRRGWYHEAICCYVSAADLEQHGRIAAMQAANTLGIELPEECYL